MIYSIAHYPVHLIDVVRLADGSRVTIRPTLPQDLELQREFFHSLSAEGRYRRFLCPLNELPETVAQRFLSIDYRTHLALLAEVFDDGREIMIGEARYVVNEPEPAICEFAIAVANDSRAESAVFCWRGWSVRRRLRVSGACLPILTTTTRRCAHSPSAADTRFRRIATMPGSSGWRKG